MTPKEKAEDLIDLFVRDGYDLVMSEKMAKRCALIAVNEILNVLEIPEQNIEREFWYEVEQEINNL